MYGKKDTVTNSKRYHIKAEVDIKLFLEFYFYVISCMLDRQLERWVVR